jgi:hypothetical protein
MQIRNLYLFVWTVTLQSQSFSQSINDVIHEIWKQSAADTKLWLEMSKHPALKIYSWPSGSNNSTYSFPSENSGNSKDWFPNQPLKFDFYTPSKSDTKLTFRKETEEEKWLASPQNDRFTYSVNSIKLYDKVAFAASHELLWGYKLGTSYSNENYTFYSVVSLVFRPDSSNLYVVFDVFYPSSVDGNKAIHGRIYTAAELGIPKATSHMIPDARLKLIEARVKKDIQTEKENEKKRQEAAKKIQEAVDKLRDTINHSSPHFLYSFPAYDEPYGNAVQGYRLNVKATDSIFMAVDERGKGKGYDWTIYLINQKRYGKSYITGESILTFEQMDIGFNLSINDLLQKIDKLVTDFVTDKPWLKNFVGEVDDDGYILSKKFGSWRNAKGDYYRGEFQNVDKKPGAESYSGRGILLTKDGTKYIGFFKGGLLEFGVCMKPNGDTILGAYNFQAASASSQANGIQLTKYGNGVVFVNRGNSFSEGISNNDGMCIDTDGNLYSGTFWDKKNHLFWFGNGEILYRNGNKLSGEFDKGTPSGKMRLDSLDGSTRFMNYVNGQRVTGANDNQLYHYGNYGQKKYPNGDIYIGGIDILDGKPSGLGVLKYGEYPSKGDIQYGKFNGDKKFQDISFRKTFYGSEVVLGEEGTPIIYWSSGGDFEIRRGNEGIKSSNGVIGMSYNYYGVIEDDSRLAFYPNGDISKGIFKTEYVNKGITYKLEGSVIYIDEMKQEMYAGPYKNGVRNGAGRLTGKDGFTKQVNYVNGIMQQ